MGIWNEGESHGSLPIGSEKRGPTANIGRYFHEHMDKHVHRSKGEVLVPNAAGPCVA
jgi:hypothetical protein